MPQTPTAHNTTPPAPARRPWLRVAALLLAAAALGLIWLLPLDQFPSLCTTRRIAGIPCPTCGMGRSLHALLHADVRESFRYHPLGPVFAAAAVLWFAANATVKTRTGRALPSAAGWTALAAGGALLIAVWLVRLVAGTVP
jgi:hypothetical protein